MPVDRVARNHDVSRSTVNHNIILLDHEIFLRECLRFFSFFTHMGGTVANFGLIFAGHRVELTWALNTPSFCTNEIRTVFFPAKTSPIGLIQRVSQNYDKEREKERDTESKLEVE